MLLFSKLYSYSKKIPEDFGYRPIAMKYQDEPVDIIVISKKGEEKLAKPIFFFCQESLPKPVIKYNKRGLYPIIPLTKIHF